MAISSFPRNWSLLSGTLGTDITTATAVAATGGNAFHWPSTAGSNAELVTDWIPVANIGATGTGNVTPISFGVKAALRSSSTAANDDVRMVVEVGDSNRAVGTAYEIYNAPLGTANTWLPIGSMINLQTEYAISGYANYIRLKFDRPTDVDFDLYLDSIEVKQFPAGEGTRRSLSGTFTGTWTKINTSASLGGSLAQISGSNTILTYAPGLYIVTAFVEIEDAVADGDIFGLRIRLDQYNGATPIYYGTTTLSMGAAHTPGNNLGLSTSALVTCFANRTSSGVVRSPSEISAEVAQHAGSFVDYSASYVSVARITDR